MFPNILALAAVLATLTAFNSADRGDSSDWRQAQTTSIGMETRSLLEFQREGLGASQIQQTFSPAVQERILQRYLDSFTYSIPQRFGRESFL